jgi:hypothetical protein
MKTANSRVTGPDHARLTRARHWWLGPSVREDEREKTSRMKPLGNGRN